MASIKTASITLKTLIKLVQSDLNLAFNECFSKNEVIELLMVLPVKKLSRGLMADFAGHYKIYFTGDDENSSDAHDFSYDGSFLGHPVSIILSSEDKYLIVTMCNVVVKVQDVALPLLSPEEHVTYTKEFTINGIKFIPETSLIELFASFID